MVKQKRQVSFGCKNLKTIGKLDTVMFTGLKQLKVLLLDRNQATYKCDGKSVNQDEFKQLLRNLTNKDIYVNFY